jgi:SAM-dependent methyltransferase
MSSLSNKIWDERYSASEYAYGVDPNLFFKEQLDKLTPGKILMLGEGEGRNGVYAAKKNWVVDAVDFSEQARIKALKLAAHGNVNINYTVSNLLEYIPGKENYDAAGIVYVHLNKTERSIIFPRLVDSLKKDGVLIIEVFSKKVPLSYKGGPRDQEYLYDLDDIKELFKDFELVLLEEITTEIFEGEYHKGEAIVIRYVGKKKSNLL